MREIIFTAKIAVYPLAECSEAEKKLIDAAKSATQKAYAPYSGFKVGAALLLDGGIIITGNNQENAAYPSGLCAERTALFYANALHPDKKVEAIAIAAFHDGQFTRDAITPCGACRQALLEAENRFQWPIRVLMVGEEGIYVASRIKDLLPLSFGDDRLKKQTS